MKKHQLIIFTVIAIVLLLPVLALAQLYQEGGYLAEMGRQMRNSGAIQIHPRAQQQRPSYRIERDMDLRGWDVKPKSNGGWRIERDMDLRGWDIDPY